jgi:teichuronic acid biosynthesis glycosyltransferase TuaG
LTPLVSIITPAFNAAGSIAATIESVLAQTWSHWELIVVDDHSTDGSGAIVAALAQQDARISLLPLAVNCGAPARPRNLGIAQAQGEWIAFLDADDIWHPDKLADQMAALTREHADFCCTRMLDFEGTVPAFDQPVAVTVDRVTFRQQRLKSRIPASSVVVRKRLMLAHPFNEDPGYRAVEDYHCWLRILQSTGPAIKLRYPYLYYRRSPGQISRSKVAMLGKIYRVHRDYPGSSLLAAALFTVTYMVGGVYYRWLGGRL